MKISYMDDQLRMALAAKSRNYTFIREDIRKEKEKLAGYVEDDGELYGFSDSLNEPLTKLCGFEVRVIRFCFTGIETVSSVKQREALERLTALLKAYMMKNPCYYNVRVPAIITDAAIAVNSMELPFFFCGGTQAFMASRDGELLTPPAGQRVEMPEGILSAEDRKRLLRITDESFRDFLGQYHISPVTRPCAGDIYVNWMKNAMKQPGENRFLIARSEREASGYAYIEWKEKSADLSLTAVAPEYRGRGIYRALISAYLQMCREEGRLAVASTQFDNFGSQTTWTELGMKPFFAIYNYHYDLRKNI